MVIEPKPKKKKRAHWSQIWALRLALVSAIFSCGLFLAGMLTLQDSPCPIPDFRAYNETSVTYSELLERHEDSDSDDFYWGFGALQIFTVGLIVYSRKLWVLALYVMYFSLSCSAFFCLGFAVAYNCSGSYLYHQQTVDFANQVYHLTAEYHFVNELSSQEWIAHLFECDTTGEVCHVRYSDREHYHEKSRSTLAVNIEGDELRMYVDGELVYTVTNDPDLSTSDALP